jgi:hypothetical protein
MSEDVRVTGKLIPIQMNEAAFEAFMKYKGFQSKPDYYESWEEFCTDELEEFVSLNGNFYRIENLTYHNPYDTLCNLSKDLEFDCMYHNGGTCWQELVAEKLNENQKANENLIRT